MKSIDNIHEGYVFLSSFDLPDVGSVKVAEFSKLFLTYVKRITVTSDAVTELSKFSVRLSRHGAAESSDL